MAFGVVGFLNNVVQITIFPNLEMGDMAFVNAYDCL